MNHVGYLDGWRGMAIALLLIGHFFPVPGLNLGHAGVNLFFVLSGLLMARLLFIKQVPFGQFYRRRVARVFPAAYVFIGAMVLVNLVAGLPVSAWEVVTAATFTNNYWSVFAKDATMPFGHLWSLGVEEHSYVLLSLAAVAARRGWFNAKLIVGLCAAVFAAIGFYYWIKYSGSQLYAMSLHTEVAAFGIFASAFLAMHFAQRPVPKLPAVAVPGLLAVGIMAHWWSVPAPTRLVIGVGCFCLAVNLLEGAHSAVHRALSLRPLRQLGLWSFSLYVWQQPFYLMVEHQGMNAWLGLALGMLCGLSSFYLIENPVRLWLNRKWLGAEPPPISAAAAPSGPAS